MFVSTESIWHSLIRTCGELGVSYVPPINTTLNEKFKIGDPNRSGSPVVNAVVFGALPVNIFDDNTFNMLELKRSATDGALLQHVPILIREKGDDISGAIAGSYGLREERNINGVDYILYHAKMLDAVSPPKIYELLRTSESEYGLFDFGTEKLNILNPEHMDVEPFTHFNKDRYITAMREVQFEITTLELQSMKEAIDILYPGRDYIIGEVGIVSSILDNGMHCSTLAYSTSTNISLDEHINQQRSYYGAITLGGLEMKINRNN